MLFDEFGDQWLGLVGQLAQLLDTVLQHVGQALAFALARIEQGLEGLLARGGYALGPVLRQIQVATAAQA